MKYIITLIIISEIVKFIFVPYPLSKYDKTYYLVTDKRVIIRTGVFGIDFNALDISKISASSVTVSLLDKLHRKNTGTIQFGSSVENSVNAYMFTCVKEPYKVHKEIKEFINVSEKKD